MNEVEIALCNHLRELGFTEHGEMRGSIATFTKIKSVGMKKHAYSVMFSDNGAVVINFSDIGLRDEILTRYPVFFGSLKEMDTRFIGQILHAVGIYKWLQLEENEMGENGLIVIKHAGE